MVRDESGRKAQQGQSGSDDEGGERKFVCVLHLGEPVGLHWADVLGAQNYWCT